MNPIPLRVIETPAGSWYDTQPGDCWLCPNAQESHTVEGRGRCWVVRLPNDVYVWHTNMEATDGGFWDITGEPPSMTVHPSIDAGGVWHGHIKNGQLVD